MQETSNTLVAINGVIDTAIEQMIVLVFIAVVIIFVVNLVFKHVLVPYLTRRSAENMQPSNCPTIVTIQERSEQASSGMDVLLQTLDYQLASSIEHKESKPCLK
jgi:hypothetical protein